MKLLIVDDHAGIRAEIRHLAGPLVVEVRECGTAENALALAWEFAPDIVTMDARLPGLGGIEATRMLCALQPGTAIVVVSAFDLPALRVAARQAGASDFVSKAELQKLQPIISRLRAEKAGRPSDSSASDASKGAQ